MLTKNPSFETILSQDTPAANFFRFCLSDKVSLTLDKVLEETMSPVDYAQALMKSDYHVLKKEFFSDLNTPEKLSETLIHSWMYDTLVETALLMRTITVRPHRYDAVLKLMSAANIFLLTLDDKNIPYRSFGGLTHYEDQVSYFVQYNEKDFVNRDVSLLNPFIKHVGSISQSSWLLYDPLWKKIHFNFPKRLQALRNFLHVVLASHMVFDDRMSDLFGMERDDIESLMYEFIELRSSPNTKIEEIKHFSNRLLDMFDFLEKNYFYAFMLEGPFVVFKDIDHQHHFTQMTKSQKPDNASE